MCLTLLRTKSLTAAVSGSEKAVGPWYVSKHLSLEDPPATNERYKDLSFRVETRL